MRERKREEAKMGRIEKGDTREEIRERRNGGERDGAELQKERAEVGARQCRRRTGQRRGRRRWEAGAEKGEWKERRETEERGGR